MLLKVRPPSQTLKGIKALVSSLGVIGTKVTWSLALARTDQRFFCAWQEPKSSFTVPRRHEGHVSFTNPTRLQGHSSFTRLLPNENFLVNSFTMTMKSRYLILSGTEAAPPSLILIDKKCSASYSKIAIYIDHVPWAGLHCTEKQRAHASRSWNSIMPSVAFCLYRCWLFIYGSIVVIGCYFYLRGHSHWFYSNNLHMDLCGSVPLKQIKNSNCVIIQTLSWHLFKCLRSKVFFFFVSLQLDKLHSFCFFKFKREKMWLAREHLFIATITYVMPRAKLFFFSWMFHNVKSNCKWVKSAMNKSPWMCFCRRISSGR